MNSIFYVITLVVSSWKDENLKLVTVQEKKHMQIPVSPWLTNELWKKTVLLRVTFEYSLPHQRHENLFFKNPLVIWFNFLLCIYSLLLKVTFEFSLPHQRRGNHFLKSYSNMISLSPLYILLDLLDMIWHRIRSHSIDCSCWRDV